MVIIPWWDAIEIWFIRAKVQFGVWFKNMGQSRISSIDVGVEMMLLVKSSQTLSN